MGGFNYGGKGDGVPWSSEYGDGPEPGGGDHGNSGNHDTNSSAADSNNAEHASRAQKQLADIVNDPQVRQKLQEIIYQAKSINPDVKISGVSISSSGKMRISFDGLNINQVSQLGLTNLLTVTNSQGLSYTNADLETGHTLTENNTRVQNRTEQEGFWDKRAINSSGESFFVNTFIPIDIKGTTEKKISALPKSMFDKKLAEATKQVDKYNNVQQKQRAEASAHREEAKKQAEEEQKLKDAIKFTLAFYEGTFERFGEISRNIARELADAAKGKKLRNAQEALDAFEKYGEAIRRKFGSKDRAAIAAALESLSRDEMAKNMARFSRAFMLTAEAINFYDLYTELVKAVKTEQWRPFFVKAETLLAGKGATAITAWAFSIIAGTPLRILGFALVIAIVSAMIDDQLIERVNKLLGL